LGSLPPSNERTTHDRWAGEPQATAVEVFVSDQFSQSYWLAIQSELRRFDEVHLNLACQWFCRLDLTDAVPDHSTFSKNRRGRFRDNDLPWHLFERLERL